MAAPTWATDPIGTALTMLGKGSFTIDKLNRVANHDDKHVVKATAFGATGLSPTEVSVGILNRTGFPTVPYVGRLIYDATLDEEYGDIVGSQIAAGQRVVPTGGGDGVWCYVARKAGRFASAAEPTWTLLTTEDATRPEPYATTQTQWTADTEYALYDEVIEKRVDWAAGAVKAVGNRVYPTSKNGYVYECVAVGFAAAALGDNKTHAATEPTWPTTVDATVDDDDVRWKCVLPLVATCVARADDFKSHATVQPVWPKEFFEVVDDKVTWTMRRQYTYLEEPLLNTASKWVADTVTAFGAEVIPAYDDWVADTATLIGAIVYPTVPNGYAYECIARAGDFKTGLVEPSWVAGVVGATTTDDQITWRSFIPMTMVCTGRAGDFKTDAAAEPTWPTALGNTVLDDQITWTGRRLIWMPVRVGDERVQVTAQSNGGGTTATLTLTRNFLPAHGEAQLHLRSFPPVTPFSVTGRYYTASAVDTFLHFTAGEQVALAKALNLYFGLHKSWGKRIAKLLALSSVDKELTFTTVE